MRLTLKAKLGAAFAIVVLLAAGGMFLGIVNMGDMKENYEGLINNRIQRVRLVHQIDAAAVRVDRNEKNMVLAESAAEIDKLSASTAEYIKNIDKLVDQMYELSGEQGRAAIDSFRESWTKFLESDAKVAELASQKSISTALQLTQNEGREAFHAMREKQEELEKDLRITAEQAAEKAFVDRYVAVADIMPIALMARTNLLYVLATSTDPKVQQDFAKVVKESLADLDAQFVKAEAVLTGLDRTRLKEVKSFAQNWTSIIKQALAKGLENGDYQASVVSTEGADFRRAAVKVLNDLTVRMRKEVDQGQADATAAYEQSRLITIGALVLISLIAVISATWIIVNITRAVSSAVTLARAVADGDLNATANVKSNDEIKDLVDALNQMVVKLREVVGEVATATRNVASGSQELSAAAEQLSQGAVEQSSSTEEASSSVEQMAANIKQNADNSGQTQSIARQASVDAETSGKAVGEAVKAMETIAEKILIVQEIARQTDLLALNAAVEAARAGEHGRGFAVVASEVRKLAERSRAAAQEISALSGDTVKAAQSAGEMLFKLVPDIQKTAELVAEISAASNEQNAGASQINAAIQQLDKVTQQNTSAAEEMSSTSEELAIQAEQLQNSISYFRLNEVAGAIARSAVKQSSMTVNSVVGLQEKVKAAAPHMGNPRRASGNGGFSFDMGSGSDALDAEFKRESSAA